MSHLKLILLVSSFIIPFVLAVTLLVMNGKSSSKKVIGLGFFNAFYVFLANYFYFHKLFEIYSWLHSLHIATVLWIFPSIYLYVITIIEDKKTFKRKLIHLLPGAIFGITSAILFYGLLNLDERILYLSTYRSGNEFFDFKFKLISWFRLIDVAMIFAQVIYYTIIFIKIPKTYNDKLQNEYSNIENFSINWIKWFNISFVIIGVLSISFYVFNPFQENNDIFLVAFLFVISSFIWVIGIWTYKQERPDFIDEETEQNSELSKVVYFELSDKLIEYFEKEKPYLDADLNLTTVCRKLGTNRTYLSSLINKKFGMNFNSFVNQYRSAYVNSYMKKNPKINKEELVTIGGFGSLSSLRRALSNFEQSSANYPETFNKKTSLKKEVV